MDKTLTDIITPGGTPDLQVNPLSSEVGSMDSGGNQLLLPKQQQIIRPPILQLGTEYNTTPTESYTIQQQINNQIDMHCEQNQSYFNELVKANEALKEVYNTNKQLNDAVAWMQKHIESLEKEVKSLKSKEKSSPTNKGQIEESPAAAVQKKSEIQYQTDSDDLAEETGWLRVKNKKRKRNDTPTPPQVKQPATKIIKKKPKKLPPPPPIIIDSVTNYHSLYENIKKVTSVDNVTTKVMNGNNLKINVQDGEAYRNLTRMLKDTDLAWHSFENKQTRPIRVMAKKLHYTCKPEKIIEDLVNKGYKATEASNKLNWRTKQPLNMFILTFTTDEDIKKIYEIRNILGCKVNIEHLKNSKLIPQCKHCQSYGHTQKYCNKQPRCVKCAGKHHTKECGSQRIEHPKCIHCGGKHPANYRGCSIAIELQNLRNKKNSKNLKLNKKKETENKQQQEGDKGKNKPNPAPPTVTSNRTYAQVTKNSTQGEEGTQNNSMTEMLQTILNKLNQFDDRLKKLEYSTRGAIPKPKNVQ